MRALFLFLLLLFGFILNANNASKKADSLIALSKTAADTQKVNLYLAACRSLWEIDDAKSLEYANVALQLAEKIGFKKAIPKAHGYMGIVYDNLGRGDTAMVLYIQSAKEFEEVGNLLWASYSYRNLAVSYRQRGWYKEAMKYFLDALRVCETMKDTAGIILCYISIGGVHDHLENEVEGIKWHRKALQLGTLINDKYSIALAYNNLGVCNDDIKNYDSAIYYHNLSLKLYEELSDYGSIVNSCGNLGNTFTHLKKYDEAEKILEQGIKISTIRNVNTVVLFVYINLGMVYTIKNKFADAEKMLFKALDLNKTISYTEKEMEAYYRLNELYQKQNKHQLALVYFQKYVTLRDSLYKVDAVSKLAEMQTLYETEKKEAENNELKTQNLEKEVAIKSRNSYLVILSALVAVVVLLSLLFYNRYKSKQEKILAHEVLKQQDQRTRAVIEAEEKERARIARELHDSVGQQLSAVKINLSALEGDLQNQKTKYELLINLVDEAVREVRNISHNMMPNTLMRSGLVSAVREFVDKIAVSGLAKINLEIAGLENRLGATVETVLYRVLQECVSNIIKHAHAKTITIQFVKHDDAVSMMIEDDGSGFDTKNINDYEGIGLKNIISRVQFFNGTVGFDSALGKGTTANIEIPVNAHS